MGRIKPIKPIKRPGLLQQPAQPADGGRAVGAGLLHGQGNVYQLIVVGGKQGRLERPRQRQIVLR